jgi:ABC-type glycerol-3-phosphate transport system permease component
VNVVARRVRWVNAIGGAYVVVYAVFTLLPVYWALLFTLGAPILPVRWGSFVPRDLTLHGYAFLRTSTGWLGFRNSLFVASATTVASLAIGLPAAFAIARLRRGARPFLLGALVLRLLPPVAIMLPAFLLAHDVHLRDTLTGLVAAYTVFSLPFTIWLGYGFFKQIPPELEDAALIDGCTNLQAFRLVSLPLALPAVLAAGAVAFVFAWTEFFIAFIFFLRHAVTLPLQIGSAQAQAAPPFQLALLGLVPSLVAGLVLQRAFRRRT